MKFSIDRVYRPSWLVRLKSSPGRLEGLDTPRPFPYAAKLSSVIQIVQEWLSFKSRHSETQERYKWSCNSLQVVEHLVLREQGKTKRVQGPSAYLFAASHTQCVQFSLQLRGGSASESDGQYPARRNFVI